MTPIISGDRIVFACSWCKTENREGAKFCRKCGEAMAQDTLAQQLTISAVELASSAVNEGDSLNAPPASVALMEAHPPVEETDTEVITGDAEDTSAHPVAENLVENRLGD